MMKPVILLLLAMSTFLGGCARKEAITWNLRHSFHLAVPQEDWPGDATKTLSPAQQEIYEKRGNPDYIRFWWRDDGNFPDGYNPTFMEKAAILKTKQSWIYIRQGDEVVFNTSYSSESVPISDKLAVIIKEGDPEARQVLQDPESGQVEEIWQFLTSGREYRFHGDTLYSTRQISDPMSSYLKG